MNSQVRFEQLRISLEECLCTTLRTFANEKGAQLVELAVSLPLLLLLVVGIMDFGSAVTLKHKLAIAAEQAGRVAANQTYIDVTNTLPKSTESIRSSVVASLLSMKINDCGLSSAVPSKVDLTWTYTAGGCAGTLRLVVNRASPYQNPGATPEWVEANKLTLSYPYQWSFGRVSRLVVPGSTFIGPAQLTVQVTAPSLN
jgi:Flp pilus assembly protein TadG